MDWENIIKKPTFQNDSYEDEKAVYARKREEVKKLSLELIDILGDMDTGELNATEERIVKDIKQIQDDMENSFSNRLHLLGAYPIRDSKNYDWWEEPAWNK